MPRLAVIGDIHDHQPRLRAVLAHLSQEGPLDGVLLVGDIAANPPFWQRAAPAALVAMRDSIRRIVAQIEGQLTAPVRFVPGNHDPAEVPHPGNLDRRTEVLAGLRIHGIGGGGPARFGFPYEWSDEELRRRPQPDCDLLLVHSPPHGGTLDLLAHSGEHAGSLAIAERARAHRGLLVCGHIHEAVGAELLGQCLCVNVGGLGEPYGAARVAVVDVHRDDHHIDWTVHFTELDQDLHETWTHRSPR